MSFIPKLCTYCNKEFLAPIKELNRGNGKVCSRNCARRNRQRKEDNVICSFCNHSFYLNNSQKKNSKSGLFFCCRDHKDKAQRLEFGLLEIMPDHYGTGGQSYREIAFRSFPNECAICKWSEFPKVLEVHHKDKNRENNKLNNLIILCPNHHRITHYKLRNNSL